MYYWVMLEEAVLSLQSVILVMMTMILLKLTKIMKVMISKDTWYVLIKYNINI